MSLFLWLSAESVAVSNDSLRSVAIRQLDSLFRELTEVRHFNGSMLVADDSGIVYQNFSGYARLGGRQLLQPHSQFEVASISKQFTAVSILMLSEEGLLDLDDSVKRFFPDFPYSGVSIRHLLCHRSGLPDYLEFAPEYFQGEGYMNNRDLMEMMVEHQPVPEFPPDTRFSYSNTGYAVLASIVEKVSGQSFVDFVNRRIFEPLQMSDTYFYAEGCRVAVNYTIGHYKNRKPYIRDALSGVVGDKGVMTTAADLYRWFFHIRSLIGDSTLQQAWSPQNGDMDSCSNYGFGWRLSCDEHQRRLVYHGGLWNGYNSLLLYRPYDHVFMVFLSNWVNGSFHHRSDVVLDIMEKNRGSNFQYIEN